MAAMESSHDRDNKCHPSFCSADSDVVLCSKDNVLFRVHSLTLKTTSGWFNTMFSLPRESDGFSDVLHLDEDADVLTGLLKMVSGMELPEMGSLDVVESILLAAEKYDMPGPVSIIRSTIAHHLTDANALRIYRLACSRFWKKEAQLASSYTLTLDLCSPAAMAEVSRMDGPAIAKLFLLHRRRRDALKDALDDPAYFSANDFPICDACERHLDHVQWISLKYAWLSRSEEAPFGRTTSVAQLHAPEVLAVVAATCPSCQKQMYMPAVTLRNLQRVVESLPQSIEFA
ncbi:uncharacterized protein LAESUDRAFT_141611 [Laetiporus sulphureus 93-53]|uniref:BTB domain-containing protein n=1 Tax=Laetiporus sulphureus 93-53 TaxID=1314785 RepID=A0A165EET3_9APHY|nr:uncharacterized protein LAESUDRAFT_141611 [Laetiporus sulphureus 93-53]KZT06897.1 hypothetical protein LAESUDRAFT_141611 [Laetiporus sulphureus 93-53]